MGVWLFKLLNLKNLLELRKIRSSTAPLLKTLTNFKILKAEKRTSELRFNDRDFKVYDMLYLQEFIPPSTYTGREIRKEVTYVLDNPDYCKEGYVVLGLKG